jgi:hypothetical protein
MEGEKMLKIRLGLAAIMTMTTCSIVVAEDVWQDYKPKVEVAAKAYIKAFAKPGDQEKWDKKLAARIEDTGRDLATIALDWFFDNEASLVRKMDDKILEACFFFMAFVRTNTPPPLQMRDRMTPQNFEDLISYLEMRVQEKS